MILVLSLKLVPLPTGQQNQIMLLEYEITGHLVCSHYSLRLYEFTWAKIDTHSTSYKYIRSSLSFKRFFLNSSCSSKGYTDASNTKH